MKTAPHIDTTELISHLCRHYDIRITGVVFLPIGEGAWCYRTSGPESWFVRIGKRPMPMEVLGLLAHLRDEGLPVICPIATRAGNLASYMGDLQLTVQPWFDGQTLMSRGGAMSRVHVEIGELAARVHATDVRTGLPREHYRRYQQDTRDLLNAETSGAFLALREAVRPEIERILDAAVVLGERLRTANPRQVVCHGDLHDDNVLMSDSGEIRIIDWDGGMLAPPERDLFHFMGVGWNDYMQGYDPGRCASVDQALLDYYVLEWALQEVVDYGSRIVFDTRFDAGGKADALHRFRDLFEPGGDVDRALTVMAGGMH